MRANSKSKNVKSTNNKESLTEKQKPVIAMAGNVSNKRSIKKKAAHSRLAEVTGEERHQLIAEAAYFHAERRNFTPGCELDDWLNAEAEVEELLLNVERYMTDS